MKNNLLFMFLFFTFLANAQKGKVEKNQFKINFLIPGIEYEIGLTDKTSLDLELGIGFMVVQIEKQRLLLFHIW